MYSIKNRELFEDLDGLVSLQYQVKALRLQDQVGKQTFLADMKNVFEPITGTVNQTAQKTIGVVKDTIKAIELKGEERNKATNEIEQQIRYAINFDLRLMKSLSEDAFLKKNKPFSIAVQTFFREALYT